LHILHILHSIQVLTYGFEGFELSDDDELYLLSQIESQ
jgi:hypothetical protein